MRPVIQVLSLSLVFAATVVAAILLVAPGSWELLLYPLGVPSILGPGIALAYIARATDQRAEVIRCIFASVFISGALFSLFGIAAMTSSLLDDTQASYMWQHFALLLVGSIMLVCVWLRARITGKSCLPELNAMVGFLHTQQEKPAVRKVQLEDICE